MQISEKHLLEFKALTKETVGEEKYNQLTEQDHLSSAIALVTFMEAVYKYQNRENYEAENLRPSQALVAQRTEQDASIV